MSRHYASKKLEKKNERIFVSSGEDCFVAVKKDGTVVYAGRELYSDWEYPFAEEIARWKNIKALACAGTYLLGLTESGTVELACGGTWDCWPAKQNWKNIVDIDLGYGFVVGLTADGRVVKTGRQYDTVDAWSDIVGVTACWHVVGLKSDGTVAAEGFNAFGQCNVGDWSDIVAVACGVAHTVGLKSDGTVVAVGCDRYVQRGEGLSDDSYGYDFAERALERGDAVAIAEGGSARSGACDVSGWTDIVDIAAYDNYTVGLRADGTVVTAGACPDLSSWGDIASISVSNGTVVGIRRDGRVAGYENDGDLRDIAALRYGWRGMVGLKNDGTAVGSVLRSNSPDATYANTDGYRADEIPQDVEKHWRDIAVAQEPA